MFELNIIIGTTPELGATLSRLVDALNDKTAPAPALAVDDRPVAQAPAAPVAQPVPAPAPAPVPAPTPVPDPTPVPVAQPAPAPVPAVPVAQPAAPTYTKAQIAQAGGALLRQDPGKRDVLCGLLAQYGAASINDLQDAHLGAFATALRGLGAQI